MGIHIISMGIHIISIHIMGIHIIGIHIISIHTMYTVTVQLLLCHYNQEPIIYVQ